MRCLWWNGYCGRKWTRQPELKILGEAVGISHDVNTLGKGLNPIYLPPAVGKIVGQTGYLMFGWQPVKEKENSKSKYTRSINKNAQICPNR